ncbi:UPF0104 family protein [Candidatus Peregrinibacteria bacterium]|nr:UPF0104 family protein [Candidatus Peregrinibacteria bacterium]
MTPNATPSGRALNAAVVPDRESSLRSHEKNIDCMMPEKTTSTRRALLRRLPSLVGLVLFVIAILVLRHELRGQHLSTIVRMMRSVPGSHLLLAMLLSFGCYLALTGYDALALSYLGCRLSYHNIAFASFVGYALSNNIGFSPVTGGSVRYRFYCNKGLEVGKIMHLVGFCVLTFWVGFLSLAGALFVLYPPQLIASSSLPFFAAQPVGLCFLAIVTAYLLLSAAPRKPLTLRRLNIEIPSLLIAIGQIFFASMELLLCAGILFAVLPASGSLPYFSFVSIFLLAHFAGLASQVPGGIGVFETVLVSLLPASYAPSAVLGSLVLYRIIYNVLPLATGVALLGWREFFDHRHCFGMKKRESKEG